MRIRNVVPAAAFLSIATLAWPSAADAGQRHSRSRGHGSVYDSYRAPHFYNYNYNYNYSYGYRYAHRPYGYAYAPPPVYYYGVPPAYAPPVYAPYYGYGAAPYGYGYRPYRYRPYGYRYNPPLLSFHYHGGVRCSRPHVSLHLGF